MDRSRHSISPYDVDALAGIAKRVVPPKKRPLYTATPICGATPCR
jgi:hypothetical protein